MIVRIMAYNEKNEFCYGVEQDKELAIDKYGRLKGTMREMYNELMSNYRYIIITYTTGGRDNV